MSLKNAEAPGRPKSWSLTARLTRHYVLSAIVILGATEYVLHWTLERSLDARDVAQVMSKAQVLQTLLREHHDKPEVIISEVEHEASENQALKYFLRILDGSGRTIIETTGMKEVLPPEVFLPPARVAITQLAGQRGMLAQHERYLIAAVEAEAGGMAAEKRSLQVGLDLSPTLALIEHYHRVLIGVFVAGVLVMTWVGWLVARQGVRPLVQLAETTRSITASRLNERVSAQRWPTELATLAGAFDEMLVRLQDSFQRLTEFSADIAHALRNPINNLRGEAEVALARVRTAEEYQQLLGSSLEELERLSRMIDNLLFIARADDPNMVLAREAVPLRPVLEAVKEFYEALAAEAQITVACEGEATMQADPMLVRRAVSNLLGNALKHTATGGHIAMLARSTPEGGAEIVVRDNGAGIPAELLPRVFDRFFQVDKSRDLTTKGAGLGLAIVRSIMRLHGGEATLTSDLGRGCTVTLRFPPPGAEKEM